MRITNKEFAKNDPIFKQACKITGIAPTVRQASKFRQNKGKAVRYRKAAITDLRAK